MFQSRQQFFPSALNPCQRRFPATRPSPHERRFVRLAIEELEKRDNPSGPSISAVVFDNSAPKTNDYLVAQVQDAADADSFQYLWTVNNQIVRNVTIPQLTDTLDLRQSAQRRQG